ncbi:MAG: type II and III secretion system protein family protein [Pirellulales bacterium]|nr:type II and III secretion system protein family protein [Pirellulales bacterium]
MCQQCLSPSLVTRWILCSAAVLAVLPLAARGQDLQMSSSINFEVKDETQRLEMIVNTSRILTLDDKIPQAQVNNPEVVDIKALSANQIQVVAKKPGVTQVNIWDENDQVHAIDVIVFGDARELEVHLKTIFPDSSLRVYPLPNSVLLTGFVDDPNMVPKIIEIAQDFHPKVINNITVGGVQQVLLKVKVMEVSRTKLRAMGFDFASISNGDFATSTISGLISAFSGNTVTAAAGSTFQFGIMDGNSSFFGVLEALRQDNLMKVLAEPNLVTVSGRPAFFNAGGEFPILVPQSLGTVSIEYKKFGTQVDFVPIVLANSAIRLEVRPRISEIDNTRSVTTNGNTIPGLNVREVDTGVEMKAGQVLAIAGLVSTRVESETRGVPFIRDIPYVGAPFRSVRNLENEVELLILVKPELVAGLDMHELPPGGPGMNTTNPNDHELFFKAYNEIPRCCPDGRCSDCQHRASGLYPPVGNGSVVPEVLPPASGGGVLPPTTDDGSVSIPLQTTQRQESILRPASTQNPVSIPQQPPKRQPLTGGNPGFLGRTGYDTRNK